MECPLGAFIPSWFLLPLLCLCCCSGKCLAVPERHGFVPVPRSLWQTVERVNTVSAPCDVPGNIFLMETVLVIFLSPVAEHPMKVT